MPSNTASSGRLLFMAMATALVAIASGQSSNPTTYTKGDRDLAFSLLHHAHAGIVSHYFDPSHIPGDFPAMVEDARQRLQQTRSNNESFAVIANLLGAVDTRHIRLIPLPRQAVVRHDWDWTLVDDKAYVRVVNADSDADKKGVKRGDRVLQIEALPVNRLTADRISYAYLSISPRPTLRVLLQSPNEDPRWVEITGQILRTNEKLWTPAGIFYAPPHDKQSAIKPSANHRIHDGILIWRPTELVFGEVQLRRMNRELNAARALVLDLRSLSLGSHENTMKACSLFFDETFTAYTIDRRQAIEAITVRGTARAFKKPIIVLTNAYTAYAAEALAYVLQSRNRALVMGDRSAGKFRVLEVYQLLDKFHSTHTSIYNFMTLPVAKVIVSTDNDLEGKGVTPDHLILPTAEDYIHRRDPALAKAIETLGGIFPLDGLGETY